MNFLSTLKSHQEASSNQNILLNVDPKIMSDVVMPIFPWLISPFSSSANIPLEMLQQKQNTKQNKTQ